MTSLTDINEGFSNNLLVHGVFGIILSIPFFFLSILLGVLLVALSISLFTTTNGILIDTGKMEYKKYNGWFGFKVGKWQHLSNLNSAKLILSVETVKLINIITLPRAKEAAKSRTFDIVLTDNLNNTTLLYDFLTYKNARKALECLSAIPGIVIEDKVRDKIAANQAKRRN